MELMTTATKRTLALMDPGPMELSLLSVTRKETSPDVTQRL